MSASTQITLRNVRRSPLLARRIQEKCEHLERFHPAIGHCRVSVEHQGARGDRGKPYLVAVRVGVPGRALIASEAHHPQLAVALRDAFDAAARQLRESP